MHLRQCGVFNRAMDLFVPLLPDVQKILPELPVLLTEAIDISTTSHKGLSQLVAFTLYATVFLVLPPQNVFRRLTCSSCYRFAHYRLYHGLGGARQPHDILLQSFSNLSSRYVVKIYLLPCQRVAQWTLFSACFTLAHRKRGGPHAIS